MLGCYYYGILNCGNQVCCCHGCLGRITSNGLVIAQKNGHIRKNVRSLKRGDNFFSRFDIFCAIGLPVSVGSKNEIETLLLFITELNCCQFLVS